MAREVETYLKRMAEIHATGGATSETSYYGALETLLNAVGKSLKPKVICNGQIRNQGAGHPDFGLYTQTQCRAGAPKEGQGHIPERGVIEVKSLTDENWKTAKTAQISKYWQRYRLVLVTNYRDFLLIGVDTAGQPVRLEGFSLADSDAAFWKACARPRRTAREKGAAFVEYLKRALVQTAPLNRPADLAWLLASYARDALNRVERHAELPALSAVRSGLEEALGMRFEGSKGEHFFRSTLVQTLFYGVFSAWVHWCKKQPPGSTERFDWRTAGWSLHVPMVRNLFEQVATPDRLGPLDLVEVLDWTGNALNRVDRSEFFDIFDQGRAVQYFYEPFLAAYDPELRKELGVWYTPPEIVRYMVKRVDSLLQSELGIADGLADPNVYVLDPCCGTGSFVVEALNVIAERLHEQDGDALAAHDLKRAAMERIFGFEIMPAPFVIAHWQIGLRLADADAPLSASSERAGVYLTNALTGWQPAEGPKQQLIFPELEEERDAAEHVKRDVPILVVIGNPPYNAFAGTSPAEEEGLVEPFKEGLVKGWKIRKFNLDELYVRFLRVAERRIVEQTGRGIVCYISSYSYLSDASFVVARQHLLEGFDSIWIDSLNGDSRETGKLTPDGKPDPSVFSTDFNREGIKLGTAIGTFVRRDHAANETPAHVRYRDFWGTTKREQLLASLDNPVLETGYIDASPTADNRYNFRPFSVIGNYASWPRLTDIAAFEPFSGALEMRRGALIHIDLEKLQTSIQDYSDPAITINTLRGKKSGPVFDMARYDAAKARDRFLAQGGLSAGRFTRYAMYPLELRWCFHTNVRPIWNEPRPALAAQQERGNMFLISRMSAERPREGLPLYMTKALPDYHLLRPNIQAIPFWVSQEVREGDLFNNGETNRANLSTPARLWLETLGWPDPDTNTRAAAAPWLHALAVCCAPAWLHENRAAILAGWPRVPLPATGEALSRSAALGAKLANLLDPDQPVPSVTTGALEPPFKAMGVVSRVGGGAVKPEELAVTAGWGHGGGGRPVMPGRGSVEERSTYTAEEWDHIEAAAAARGEAASELIERLGPPMDVYLNDTAYWRGVPKSVWEFRIGGYQVFKKWLSYREQDVLGRPLSADDAREASRIVRRLAAIVLMQPELDENYRSIRGSAYVWPSFSTE